MLGLCLLNAATFPPPAVVDVPRWRAPLARVMQLPPMRLASSWVSMQRRLHLNHVFVALEEGVGEKVIGSVEIHTSAYLRKQGESYLTQEQAAMLQPYLASLAVHEDARGRGIGRALVEAAAEETRSVSGDDYLLLQVEANNTAAVRLYQRCDFETLGAPGCEINVMRRRLRAPSRAAEATSTAPGASRVPR